MANSYSTTPAQKPPQTAGQRASDGLAGSGGKIKAYMDARGAKPVAGLGVSQSGPKNPGTKPPQGAGQIAKGRRQQGKPVSSANQRGRAYSTKPPQGGPKPPQGGPKPGARFSDSNRVPLGGGKPPIKPGIGAGGQGRFGGNIGGPGGPQRTMDRVKAFNAMRAQQKPGAGSPGLTGIASRMGARTGGGANPGAVNAARGAMQQMQQGHSSHPKPGAGGQRMPPVVAPKPGPVGSAQTMKPPTPAPKPSIQPVGGGGGTLAQGRQRPKMM
jgi:hypothetical protein